MENKYSTTPLYELLTEMTYLEQEINMKLLMYEQMRQEVVRRFPPVEKDEIFKEKVLVKKEVLKNDLYSDRNNGNSYN